MAKYHVWFPEETYPLSYKSKFLISKKIIPIKNRGKKILKALTLYRQAKIKTN